MNINPVTPVGNSLTANQINMQFLARERVSVLNQLRIQNAENVAKDFRAAQNVRADSTKAYQNKMQASDLSMLQFLQNGRDLASIFASQGGAAAVTSTVAPELLAAGGVLI